MIQKAYIVSQSEKEPNKFKVRIPVIHGLSTTPSSTRDEDLPYATVCGIDGIIGVFHPGDVVFVGFENGEFGTPVILGQLMLNLGRPVTEEASKKRITTDAKFSSLTVSGHENSATPIARLPEDTEIGDVTSFEIASLSGVRKNLQAQIDELSESIQSIPRE